MTKKERMAVVQPAIDAMLEWANRGKVTPVAVPVTHDGIGKVIKNNITL
jgi:hypothetical protein